MHVIDKNIFENFSELPVAYLHHHIYSCEFLVATIFIANPLRVFSCQTLVSENRKCVQEEKDGLLMSSSFHSWFLPLINAIALSELIITSDQSVGSFIWMCVNPANVSSFQVDSGVPTRWKSQQALVTLYLSRKDKIVMPICESWLS